MDHDSCLIADHRRGVVFFLTWDGMVENLGQPYGQGFRAAHAARLCYEDLPRGHEISDPIREGEKGRLVSLRFRDALQPFAGTLVRAAEHDELHGLAGPQQHRYRLFQVPTAQTSTHYQHDREIVSVQFQEVQTSLVRTDGLFEDRVYGDTGWVDPYLR